MSEQKIEVQNKAAGTIGVPRLERIWSRCTQRVVGNSEVPTAADSLWDKVVLYGLGLALEETIQFLFQKCPTFSEFEQWIIEKNNGQIDPLRIERINAALNGQPTPEAVRRRLREIDESEPDLSAADLAFWDEHGYVVLHDAVPVENRIATERLLWERLKMDPENPATWYDRAIGNGIMVQTFHHPVMQANRESLRLHKAFAQLWGTSDLWVTIDRLGFNPPERPNWKFPGPHLHWDTSIVPPIPFDVGGILYLTDTLPEQGAFTCVPGFHRRLPEWLASLPPGADPRQESMERLGAVPIAGKAGDLVIWHQALPHGSRPNRTDWPRMVQYISMFKAEPPPERPWK